MKHKIDQETEELLEDFVKWYWREVDGKPYDINSYEVVESFKEEMLK